jgi:hypothetical protein
MPRKKIPLPLAAAVALGAVLGAGGPSLRAGTVHATWKNQSSDDWRVEAEGFYGGDVKIHATDGNHHGDIDLGDLHSGVKFPRGATFEVTYSFPDTIGDKTFLAWEVDDGTEAVSYRFLASVRAAGSSSRPEVQFDEPWYQKQPEVQKLLHFHLQVSNGALTFLKGPHQKPTR